MSTSLNSVALSLLSSSSSSGSGTDLLSILYGTSGSSTTSSNPVATLLTAETNLTKNVKLQEQQPQTKAEIARFLSVVSKATDLKTVLADPTARKVLLTANGLGSEVDYPALALKALSSDPSKSGNLASTLSNSAWATMTKTYNFAKNGLSVLKQQSVLTSITDGYAQIAWSQTADQSTPGLSKALDFRARASTITSIDQILGDPNFRTVISVAYGLPPQVATQSISTQEHAFSAHIDITKLKDPKFVENLARQYLINNQDPNSSWAGITI